MERQSIEWKAARLHRREEAGRERLRLGRVRGALDQVERDALDREVLERVQGLCRGAAPGAADALGDLIRRGGSTDSLPEHELAEGGNYARLVQAWLQGERPEPEVAKALAILVGAGDAFITNRAYAGNGGAPAVVWLLEFLGQGHSEDAPGPEPAEVAALLDLHIAHAPEDSPFWFDLAHSAAWELFRPVSRAGAEASETQVRVCRELLSLALDPFSDELIGQVAGASTEASGYGSLEALARVPVDLASSTVPEALTAPLFEPGRWSPLELWTWVFGTESAGAFFRSGASRAALNRLVRSSRSVRRGLLGNPPLVFWMVDRCERRILESLLQKEPEAMGALRDGEQGDTLLHRACRSRGLVQALVKSLVAAGFDPEQGNDGGESARALAEAVGRRKTIAALG